MKQIQAVLQCNNDKLNEIQTIETKHPAILH